MHFLKPLWLTHGGDKKDHEVYSCHISPDGSRLVTAAGDGHVRIWSTEAIYNSSDPEHADKPKQLAALSYHSGTIHSVRFSGNNKYLASGADDKLLCVYVLDSAAPIHASTFGSNEPPPVENWRVFRRLIGHENDVQDIGWSCDSSILVSVGLDSKVVVWSGHTFEKLKTLSQHQSHVKGISFDPANKYFATASDDRTIKVFRFSSPPPNATAHDQANNFTLESTVTKPFTSSPLTTYFRRPSWSPDGNHIAAANAVNGPVSAVAIINRGSWDSEINLIGHEAPTEVCAFSPRLFGRDPPGSGQSSGHVTIVACAGQDKTLTVWNTSFPRPFVITHELAAKSISDLAWSPDGERLFLTSLDGTIAVAVFEKGELGYPQSVQENEKALAKFGAGRKVGIVEGTDALRLEEQSREGELKGVQGRMGELMGDGAANSLSTTNGTSHANGGPDTKSTASTNMTNGDSAKLSQQPSQLAPDPYQARIEKIKQRVTITKDGRKRIAPLLVSSSSGVAEQALPKPNFSSATAKQQGLRDDAPQAILDLSKPYDGLPKGGLAALVIGNKRKLADVEGDEDRSTERRIQAVEKSGATPVLINDSNGLAAPTPSARAPENNVPGVLRPAIISPSMTVSPVRLAIPMVRSFILRPLERSMSYPGFKDASMENHDGDTVMKSSSTVLEARNSSGPSRTGRPQDRDPTRISCTRGGKILWHDFLPRAVLLTTGNKNFWAAACEDGSVHVWTPAGRRYVNPLVLEAQPVILDCRGWNLLAISSVGICHIWNMKTLSSPHSPISLAPALDIAVHNQGPHLTGAPALVFARLNSQGRIIIAMSNGDGYSYHPGLYAWQRLSEAWWAVGSQYWNTLDSSAGSLKRSAVGVEASDDDDEVSMENVSAGIIPLLERNTTNQTLLKGRAYFLKRLVNTLLSAEGYESFESSVSVAHLENRVAAAMMLGAKEEFRVYLLMYAKRLGAEGLKGKVEELLRSLLGHHFLDGENVDLEAPDAGQGWQTAKDELVGWKRDELLREIVLILGKHRDIQRTTVPYARVLGIIGKALHDEDAEMSNNTS